uniref:POU domain, class 6, transcription factor 2 n=1 Tax=Syphacia muris TaxID=451379 RepID=A0A0N5ARA4_9BILA
MPEASQKVVIEIVQKVAIKTINRVFGCAKKIMVIHTVHPESVNSNILLQSEKEAPRNVGLTFQQTSEVYRPHIPTSLNSSSQQVLHMTPDKKATVPSSFASVPQLNSAICNTTASSSLFGTPNVANPFLLTALLSMQPNPVASPLSSNIQAFNALIPYLQQVPNVESEYLMQNILALQQIATAQQLAATSQPTVIPQQQQTQPQQQQSSQQWLSPTRTAASGSENVPSLPLSTSEEPLSVLSESSHVSPRPRVAVTSDKNGQLMVSEDEFAIESLIESRKGLSEKESIAVAVLAGMAGYQR